MRPLLFSAVLFCFSANAQITITSADMPSVGDTFHLFRDTLPTGFSIGPRGANVIWNFSSLTPDVPVTTYTVAPSATPYATDFPNANLALTNDFTAYLFYRNTASALKVEGFANVDPNLGVVSVNFNPIPDQYRFPSSYLSAFSGSSGFQDAKPYSQLPPATQAQIDAAVANCPNPVATVQQLRATFTSSYTDTIDAWGTVITPIGSYEALRRKRVENTRTIIDAYTNCLFVYQWVPIDTITAATTEYSWLSRETRLPLISLGYDGQRNITSVTYSTIPPPPIAGFTWVNPSGGLVNFTNTSQNNPTTFDWDFGDGTHSTLQNPPGHVYPANGTYYACLTVSNQTGSDTFCDSVHVTGISAVNHPPIAVRDSAQTVYPNPVQFNVLANDIDPDGNNIIFEFAETPVNGTIADLNNGWIEYSANSSFRGIDSFRYYIRDDGTPLLRDTGTVVILVEGLPFANFTFSSNNFTVQFVNTSTGYDSLSWNLGDGSPPQFTETVVHTYARGIYTVCLTAFNSVGEADTCKTVDLQNVGVTGIRHNDVRVFPNPVERIFEIETGNWEMKQAELSDLSGKILYRQFAGSGRDNFFFDISRLPSGIYFYKLTGKDGDMRIGKILKE